VDRESKPLLEYLDREMIIMNEQWIEPTAENVRNACKRFADDINEPDLALFELFAHYPKNVDSGHVLLKVVALNALYSTMIRVYSKITPTVYEVAHHIVAMGKEVDSGLEVGLPGLVLKISKLRKGENTFHNYSFATKYCSFHRPESYPIYDSRVYEYLRQLRNRGKHKGGGLRQFKNEELWNYPKFKGIVDEFQVHYGLQEFTYKQIDAFLYLEGGKLLSAKEQERKKL
jgi:hypothetical protein